MKGWVLDFSVQANSGLISGEDGKRYRFAGAEWKTADKMPRQGVPVDFEIRGEEAAAIYALAQTGGANDSVNNQKVVAAILALALGAFGAHKFYLGMTTSAIIMLCVSIIGFILILPPIIMGIIAFVEFIIYLTKSDEEFYQTYIVNKKGWF
jgi:TM2 domain-containing membrane protein YozV